MIHKISKINNDMFKNTDGIHSKKIMDKYQIIEKIGSGSFGEVYYAKCPNKNKYVAAKIEDKTNKSLKIKNEYKIYMELRNNGFVKGIPWIYELVHTPNYNMMFMQLLGSNLEELFNKSGRKFKVSTVLNIAIQVINLLEKLHSLNYIHRDIKPNNFMIGKDRHKDRIYIVDFGLSSKYVERGKHVEFRNNRLLIGTSRYVSINVHMGIEQSRRDDLEAVVYMLIYFLKGVLPWQNCKKQQNKKNTEIIGEIKMATCIDKLCEDLPDCFKKYLCYCRDLSFNETPNYKYLRNLFLDYHKNNNIPLTVEWIN
jgi:serine/threonine protein kinase